MCLDFYNKLLYNTIYTEYQKECEYNVLQKISVDKFPNIFSDTI